MTAVHAARTLVVDDAAEIRDLLCLAAEDRDDVEVVATAADGVEAIDQAEATQPELVILDIDMPRLDGLSALPELRRVAPDAVVVVLSAFDRSTYEHLARDRGAVGYVEKGQSPYVILDEVVATAGLLARVRRMLSGTLESGREARRIVTAALDRWDEREPMDDVELLVTELVVNAVVHGGSAPELSVLLLPATIRVEVADSSDEMPKLRQPSLDSTSGRGIALLDSLSSRWGADHLPQGGKTVWFEVARTRP